MRFLQSESGAISVDWTVLSAAVIGLGLASAAAVSNGTGNLGETIRASLSGAQVAALGVVNQARNILAGGTFETDDNFFLHGTYTVMGHTGQWFSTRGYVPGWEVLSNHGWRIDFAEGGAFYGVTNPTGSIMMDMVGGNGEHISMQQAIDAQPGQTYTLSFNAATPPAPAPHAANNNALEIWWGNTLIETVRAPESNTLQPYSIQGTSIFPGFSLFGTGFAA
jgi:hypothetical protein